MKHLKEFKRFLNEAKSVTSFSPDEIEKVNNWIDSIQEFCDAIVKEIVEGNLKGFPDKESEEPMSRLLFGVDLEMKQQRIEHDPEKVGIIEFLSCYTDTKGVYYDEPDPKIEKKLLNAYKNLKKVHGKIEKSTLDKLNTIVKKQRSKAHKLGIYDWESYYGLFPGGSYATKVDYMNGTEKPYFDAACQNVRKFFNSIMSK